MSEPIRPPFTQDSALAKVRAAEDGWNSRDPVKVSLAYSLDSVWRNRGEFVTGRRADSGIPGKEMEPGARVPPCQGTLGLFRPADRSPFPVRMAR